MPPVTLLELTANMFCVLERTAKHHVLPPWTYSKTSCLASFEEWHVLLWVERNSTSLDSQQIMSCLLKLSWNPQQKCHASWNLQQNNVLPPWIFTIKSPALTLTWSWRNNKPKSLLLLFKPPFSPIFGLPAAGELRGSWKLPHSVHIYCNLSVYVCICYLKRQTASLPWQQNLETV
jgi:hypothetical protein